MGKAIGGVKTDVGKTASDSECSDLVKSTTPGANAAVWCIPTKTCSAQVGATGTDATKTGWRTCLFKGE